MRLISASSAFFWFCCKVSFSSLRASVSPWNPYAHFWTPPSKTELCNRTQIGMENGFALATELLPLPVGSGSRQNTAAPLVQFHYRTFLPPTSCSAPVPRIGTLILAV